MARVVGSLAFGELIPAGAVNRQGLAEKFGEESVLLELGEAVEDWVAGVSVAPKPIGEGEPEEVGGLHQDMQGEGVEASAFHGGSQKAVEEGRRGRHDSLL